MGFVGGEWRGGAFYYNRAVTNVSVTQVTNVYNRTVVVNENHTAFNGGEGGVAARPTAAEEAAEHEQHTPALPSQTQHEQAAAQNRANFASENHGKPAVAATARPGDFSSHSAVAARNAGGEYHAPAMSPKEARVSAAESSRGAGTNEGFRPFTPPAKSGSSSGSTSGSAGNESHGSSTPHSQPAARSQSKPAASSHHSNPAPRHQSAPQPRHR